MKRNEMKRKEMKMYGKTEKHKYVTFISENSNI